MTFSFRYAIISPNVQSLVRKVFFVDEIDSETHDRRLSDRVTAMQYPPRSQQPWRMSKSYINEGFGQRWASWVEGFGVARDVSRKVAEMAIPDFLTFFYAAIRRTGLLLVVDQEMSWIGDPARNVQRRHDDWGYWQLPQLLNPSN